MHNKLRDMIDKPEQWIGFHEAIKAGGPGSGRHKEMNNMLSRYGYSKAGRASSGKYGFGGQRYTHSSGHRVTVSRNNSWTTMTPSGVLKVGVGTNELSTHLSSIHNSDKGYGDQHSGNY